MLRFFSSRRNWDSPNPSPAGECPPPGSGGRGTLTGERGVGRVPIPTRGHTLWYSSYICMYFVAFTVLRRSLRHYKLQTGDRKVNMCMTEPGEVLRRYIVILTYYLKNLAIF